MFCWEALGFLPAWGWVGGGAAEDVCTLGAAEGAGPKEGKGALLEADVGGGGLLENGAFLLGPGLVLMGGCWAAASPGGGRDVAARGGGGWENGGDIGSGGRVDPEL